MKMIAMTGHKGPRLRHAPMISFKEAAELFGISQATLRAEFRYSTVPLPSSMHKHATTMGRSTTWYVVKEIKAWRAAYLAERARIIPHDVPS